MFCFMTSAGKPILDPTTLSLTGYWRAYTGSAPWSGTASAGTSGSNAMSAGTAPSAGSTLNGQATASFNGSTQFLNGAGTIDTYANAKAISGWALINPTTVASNRYILLGDTGGGPSACSPFFIVSTGVVRFGATGLTNVDRTISASAWSLVMIRYDGVNQQIGVNEVPGVAGGASTSAQSANMTLTDVVRMGQLNSTGFFSGTIAEIGISDTVFTDQNFIDIKAYINSRYALAL